MTIQWYPGHMNKAKNQIQDHLKLVDLVLEVRDARLPFSSLNPVLDQMINSKPRLIILNKADLADERMTKAWINFYQSKQQLVIALDAQHTNQLQPLLNAIEQLMAPKLKKYQQSGVKNYTTRAMCIGIPNAGKSTLLNKLVGKKVAVTGNRPGVTKNQNWLKTKHHLELLDTPGVLWPKITQERVGFNLALTQAISDKVIPQQDLAIYVLEFWQQHYATILQQKYQLTVQNLAMTGAQLLMHLTTQWHFEQDFDRAANKVINDVRQGLLGRYTLDWVQEIND